MHHYYFQFGKICIYFNVIHLVCIHNYECWTYNQYYNDYLTNKFVSGTIGYDNHHVIQSTNQRDTSYVAVNIIHSTLAILLPAENVRVVAVYILQSCVLLQQ